MQIFGSDSEAEPLFPLDTENSGMALSSVRIPPTRIRHLRVQVLVHSLTAESKSIHAPSR